MFRTFADPSITTKFWYTRSSGRMEAGAKLRWDWEMFGASAWHEHTYVNVVETGYRGTVEEIAAQAIDSIAGFALVLAAAKGWLEHGVQLAVVADHVVPGLKI